MIVYVNWKIKMLIKRANRNHGIHLIRARPPVNGCGASIRGRHIMRYAHTRPSMRTMPPKNASISHWFCRTLSWYIFAASLIRSFLFLDNSAFQSKPSGVIKPWKLPWSYRPDEDWNYRADNQYRESQPDNEKLETIYHKLLFGSFGSDNKYGFCQLIS